MSHRSAQIIESMKNWRKECLCLLAAQLLLYPISSLTQSSPTDLTNLKLEDILAMRIIPYAEGEINMSPELPEERFRFAYHYVHSTFEDYQSGRTKVPTSQLQAQFPVLPLEISQDAHLISLGYIINPRLSVDIQFSYVQQSTYHISRVPGFDEFTIRSHGVGDTAIGINYLLWRGEKDSLHLRGGLILPTGSINEKGRTPRDANVDTLLPYTMQIGSGTVDFNPSLTHVRRSGKIEWINQLQGTIRIGKNHHDYSLSHRAMAKTAFFYNLLPYLQPSVKLLGVYWTRLHGQDDDLVLPNGVYPAPVTNPSLFGGRKIDFLLGLRVPIKDGFFKGQQFEIEAGVPVYQDLNGPQPGENWRIATSWNFQF